MCVHLRCKLLSSTAHLVAADNRVSGRRFNKRSATPSKNMKLDKTENRSSLKTDGAVWMCAKESNLITTAAAATTKSRRRTAGIRKHPKEVYQAWWTIKNTYGYIPERKAANEFWACKARVYIGPLAWSDMQLRKEDSNTITSEMCGNVCGMT